MPVVAALGLTCACPQGRRRSRHIRGRHAPVSLAGPIPLRGQQFAADTDRRCASQALIRQLQPFLPRASGQGRPRACLREGRGSFAGPIRRGLRHLFAKKDRRRDVEVLSGTIWRPLGGRPRRGLGEVPRRFRIRASTQLGDGVKQHSVVPDAVTQATPLCVQSGVVIFRCPERRPIFASAPSARAPPFDFKWLPRTVPVGPSTASVYRPPPGNWQSRWSTRDYLLRGRCGRCGRSRPAIFWRTGDTEKAVPTTQNSRLHGAAPTSVNVRKAWLGCGV